MFEQKKQATRAPQSAAYSARAVSRQMRSSPASHPTIPQYSYSIGTLSLFAPVQRSALGPTTAQDKLGTRIQAAKQHGQPLDETTQQTLEQGTSADLSTTRIHTDTETDQLTHLVNAKAFTSGSDVFFRAGMYQPSTSQGQRLLAHETTHVVQQAQGPVAGTQQPGGIALSDPGDPFEQAAERKANQFITGRSTSAHNGAVPQRKGRASGAPQHNTSATIVQREIMPVKENLKAQGGSAAVPDLTNTQVSQIQNATTPADRLTAIVDIVKDLLLNHKVLETPDAAYTGAEVISGTTPRTPGLLSIRVTYFNTTTGGKTALTYHDDKDDKANTESWFRLDVYAPAFQAPSILYSTIRHELIHVGQRVLTPENWKIQPTDKLKYEVNEQYKPTNSELKAAGYSLKKGPVKKGGASNVVRAVGQLNAAHMNELAPETEAELNTRFPTDTDRQLYSLYVGAGTAGPGKLQDGLQEAETYTWELVHIPETNIPPYYVVETMKLLLTYLQQIETIASSLSVLQKSYWEAYVMETARMIQSNDGAIQGILASRWTGDTTVAAQVAEAVKTWPQIVQKARDIEQLWINALAPAKAKATLAVTTGAPGGPATGGTATIGYGKFPKVKPSTTPSGIP